MLLLSQRLMPSQTLLGHANAYTPAHARQGCPACCAHLCLDAEQPMLCHLLMRAELQDLGSPGSQAGPDHGLHAHIISAGCPACSACTSAPACDLDMPACLELCSCSPGVERCTLAPPSRCLLLLSIGHWLIAASTQALTLCQQRPADPPPSCCYLQLHLPLLL